MDITTILGWLFWSVVVFFVFGGLYFFLFQSRGVTAGTMSTLVNQSLLVGWPLLFTQFNKLHLIWLLPLTYLFGVPAHLLLFRLGKYWILYAAVAANVLSLVWLTGV